MSFENVSLLILLLVPFTLFAILVLTNKEGIERVFDKKVLDRIKVENSGLSNKVRNVIFFIAIFFMIIAIGDPYIKKGQKEIEIKGLEAILALDISGSMRSKDRYPNRLEFAKKKIKELLNLLVDDEIMILTFSNDVYLVSPLTRDKNTLIDVIDGIGKEYIQRGSNFTLLAQIAAQKLKSMNNKILILVSDGGDKGDLKEFSNIIKKNNIKLYAILIGTKDGSAILDEKEKAIIKNDKIVISKINTNLCKIAKESGGDCIIADYNQNDVNKLAISINSNIGYKSNKKTIQIEDKIQLFYYPLLISLILLIIAFSSIPNKDEIFNSSKKRGDK